jgi:hypothetical protein
VSALEIAALVLSGYLPEDRLTICRAVKRERGKRQYNISDHHRSLDNARRSRPL